VNGFPARYFSFWRKSKTNEGVVLADSRRGRGRKRDGTPERKHWRGFPPFAARGPNPAVPQKFMCRQALNYARVPRLLSCIRH
jgi:hypothetical protein